MLDNKKYHIYLIDNALVNTNFVSDSGRTKALRKSIRSANKNTKWQFTVSKQVFTNEKNMVGSYITLKTPFILFLHTSNKSFKEYVNQLIESLKNNYDFNSCWIICYSGGTSSSEYNNIKKGNFSNIRFFQAISPCSNHLPVYWDIKAYFNAIVNVINDPFIHLEQKGAPIFHSLYFLCQGYLAINRSLSDDKPNEKVSEALQKMGWIDESGEIRPEVTEFIPNDPEKKYKGEEGVSSVNWWKKPFGNKIPEEDLKKECEENIGLFAELMKIFEDDKVYVEAVTEAYLALDKMFRN